VTRHEHASTSALSCGSGLVAGQRLQVLAGEGVRRHQFKVKSDKRLQYLLTRSGATNLWEQPVVGGKAHQFTKFSSGRIFDFDWSTDGKELLLARGETSSDVVLISNFR
jgi:hypothetical protein